VILDLRHDPVQGLVGKDEYFRFRHGGLLCAAGANPVYERAFYFAERAGSVVAGT
jgi:hypothetical protein